MRLPLLTTLGLILAAALLSNGCRQAARIQARASAPSAEPARVYRLADSDEDGLPDGVELRSFNDRESFRSWFTAIAEAQFYSISREWSEEQRDCAGLIRFAWREALRTHDRAWFRRMGEAHLEPVAPDVRAYTLERSPLGEKLFRTAPGTFSASDLSDGTFSAFADARTLKEFNTEFIGRDAREAKPGDLLFFRQPFVQKYPFHVMLFLGRARVEDEGADDWLVYHTGATAQDAGEVRKLRLATLERHPDPRWRPLAQNRNFLGFYRLRILQ